MSPKAAEPKRKKGAKKDTGGGGSLLSREQQKDILAHPVECPQPALVVVSPFDQRRNKREGPVASRF